MPVELIENFDNEYTFVGNDGPRLFFKTDLDAPRPAHRHRPRASRRRPDWKEIIPKRSNADRRSAWSAICSSPAI